MGAVSEAQTGSCREGEVAGEWAGAPAGEVAGERAGAPAGEHLRSYPTGCDSTTSARNCGEWCVGR